MDVTIINKMKRNVVFPYLQTQSASRKDLCFLLKGRAKMAYYPLLQYRWMFYRSTKNA